MTDPALPPWLAFFTFENVNTVYVLVGCVVLGGSAAVIGTFAFLRGRALIGDALAHAALPGVCAAFLLTGTKNPVLILAGAAASCWVGGLAVDWIVRHTRCKEDSALAMVLSVFFGLGVLLLTYIQQTGDAAQAGLNAYLFGQAASLVRRDVFVLAPVGLLLCAAAALAHKELKVICFDPDYGRVIGLPTRAIEYLLATLIVLAVAIGLQAVGVVLMAALLVTPAAAARYWTERLGVLVALAGVFGAVSGMLGAYASYLAPKMPTGPWMVMAITAFFVVSLLFAPRRGMVARAMRLRRRKLRTHRENVLRTFYRLGEQQGDWDQPRTQNDLLEQRRMPVSALRRTLQKLQRRGYVEEPAPGRYRLTERGNRDATRVTRLHRLWEAYLTHKMDIASDHVHADAEEMEHVITPELEERLVAALGDPKTDPHHRPIPQAPRPDSQPAGDHGP